MVYKSINGLDTNFIIIHTPKSFECLCLNKCCKISKNYPGKKWKLVKAIA
jgi:hypothetical protein